MRHSGHDHTIDIGQDFIHRFTDGRRRVWQSRDDGAWLNFGKGWKIVYPRQKIHDPVDQLMAIFPKLFGIHITKVFRIGLRHVFFTHTGSLTMPFTSPGRIGNS